jgi:hypothetical protein
MCRKSHGSAFATYVRAADGFRWVSGEGAGARYESSPGHFRAFCPRCGSVIPDPLPGVGRVALPAGCLEGDPGTAPIRHIFVASKASWHEITDAAPRFDEYPPGFGNAPGLWSRKRETPRSPGTVGGSCLCGAVAYEIAGDLGGIRNCHCSRDRKARSSAYAADLDADPRDLRWIRGEELLATYKLPESRCFWTCFCRACGSSMPLEVPGTGGVLVPGGSLDDDPGVREQLHMFCGSKAPWFEITDRLPRYDEYPQEGDRR